MSLFSSRDPGAKGVEEQAKKKRKDLKEKILKTGKLNRDELRNYKKRLKEKTEPKEIVPIIVEIDRTLKAKYSSDIEQINIDSEMRKFIIQRYWNTIKDLNPKERNVKLKELVKKDKIVIDQQKIFLIRESENRYASHVDTLRTVFSYLEVSKGNNNIEKAQELAVRKAQEQYKKKHEANEKEISSLDKEGPFNIKDNDNEMEAVFQQEKQRQENPEKFKRSSLGSNKELFPTLAELHIDRRDISVGHKVVKQIDAFNQSISGDFEELISNSVKEAAGINVESNDELIKSFQKQIVAGKLPDKTHDSMIYQKGMKHKLLIQRAYFVCDPTPTGERKRDYDELLQLIITKELSGKVLEENRSRYKKLKKQFKDANAEKPSADWFKDEVTKKFQETYKKAKKDLEEFEKLDKSSPLSISEIGVQIKEIDEEIEKRDKELQSIKISSKELMSIKTEIQDRENELRIVQQIDPKDVGKIFAPEIDNKNKEIKSIQGSLEKSLSPQARKYNTERLERLKEEIANLENLKKKCESSKDLVAFKKELENNIVSLKDDKEKIEGRAKLKENISQLKSQKEKLMDIRSAKESLAEIRPTSPHPVSARPSRIRPEPLIMSNSLKRDSNSSLASRESQDSSLDSSKSVSKSDSRSDDSPKSHGPHG